MFLKDEKIQHVLGHFQKDFEGGVSAENLGKSEQKENHGSCKVQSYHKLEFIICN